MNIEPFHSSERFSYIFEGAEEVWCAIVRPNSDSGGYEFALFALRRIGNDWDSLILSTPVLENEPTIVDTIIKPAGCEIWNEWSENQ